MRAVITGIALFALVWATIPDHAHAGGLYYTGAGARALGRGGAFMARADDGTALLYNPAKLADLEGMQVVVDFNLPLYDACWDAGSQIGTGGEENPDAGTYLEHFERGVPADPDVSRFGVVPKHRPEQISRSWAGARLPEVCADAEPTPVPAAVFTWQVVDNLTLAVGLVTPGVVAKTSWGSPDGTVSAGDLRPDVVCDPSAPDGVNCREVDGQLVDADGVALYDPRAESWPPRDSEFRYYCDPKIYDCDLLPTPSRHMLVEQDPIGFPLTLGFGWRPSPAVSVGLALTGQYLKVKATAFGIDETYTVIDRELRLENSIQGFVPLVNGALHFNPHPGLELAFSFRWAGAIEGATSMLGTAAAYGIGGDEAGTLPFVNEVPAKAGVRSKLQQPWEFGYGLRYALLRNSELLTGDPMVDEVFDIEIDLVYEMNGVVESTVVTAPPDVVLQPWGSWDAGDLDYDGDPAPNTTPLNFLPKMEIPRGWKNQRSHRLGGDWNVIPGVWTLRTGVNYETMGVEESLASIDVIPGERLGVHGGTTLRFGAWDVTAGYGHIFQKDIEVLVKNSPEPTAAARAIPSPLPNTPIINAGSYRVSYDLFALGVRRAF